MVFAQDGFARARRATCRTTNVQRVGAPNTTSSATSSGQKGVEFIDCMVDGE
jgi:hypothetical protein